MPTYYNPTTGQRLEARSPYELPGGGAGFQLLGAYETPAPAAYGATAPVRPPAYSVGTPTGGQVPPSGISPLFTNPAYKPANISSGGQIVMNRAGAPGAEPIMRQAAPSPAPAQGYGAAPVRAPSYTGVPVSAPPSAAAAPLMAGQPIMRQAGAQQGSVWGLQAQDMGGDVGMDLVVAYGPPSTVMTPEQAVAAGWPKSKVDYTVSTNPQLQTPKAPPPPTAAGPALSTSPTWYNPNTGQLRGGYLQPGEEQYGWQRVSPGDPRFWWGPTPNGELGPAPPGTAGAYPVAEAQQRWPGAFAQAPAPGPGTLAELAQAQPELFKGVPTPAAIPPGTAPAPAAPTAPTAPAPAAAAPTAAPAPVPAAPGVPGAPTTGDPYSRFKDAFREAFGRDISQAAMNDNRFLATLDNRLFRELPLDRQVGFDAKRLAALSNNDLERLITFNPSVIGGFGTERLATFSKDFLRSTVLPFLDKNDLITANNLRGATGLPPAAPAAPAPGAPAPTVAAPATPTIPPALGAPAVPGVPGQYALPTGGVLPTLPQGEYDPLQLYLGISGIQQPYSAAQARAMGTPGVTPGIEAGGAFEPPVPTPAPTPPGATTKPPFPETPTTVGGGRVPSQGELVGADLLQQQVQAQIDSVNANITLARQQYELAVRNADRDAMYQALNYQRELEQSAEQLKQRQAELALQTQQVATQRELGLGAQELTREQMLGYADLAQGIPTLEREVAVSQARQRDAATKMQAAKDAAGIALQMGDQAEAKRQTDLAESFRRAQLAETQRQFDLNQELQRAGVSGYIAGAPTLEREVQIGRLGLERTGQEEARRQFDVNELFRRAQLAEDAGQFDEAQSLRVRAQGLQEEIQRGQLGLAGRAQTEAERAGAFGREMQTAQFERETWERPGGYLGAIYQARGQTAPPGAVTSAYTTQGLAPTRAPLTAGEIAASPYTPKGVQSVLTGEQMPGYQASMALISPQTYGQLLPSERKAYTAAVSATGMNPEDYYAESSRLFATGEPYRASRVQRPTYSY